MPLTDLYWSVDEFGAWDGGAGSGRAPGSAAALGYADRALLATLAPAGAGVILMSQVSTAPGAAVSLSLTSAHLDGDTWGVYGDGAHGFQAPSTVSPTTINGEDIYDLISGNNSDFATGFWVRLYGTLAQSLFTSITVNGVTYTTASATFSAGATTSWKWGGANPFEATGAIAGSYIV